MPRQTWNVNFADRCFIWDSTSCVHYSRFGCQVVEWNLSCFWNQLEKKKEIKNLITVKLFLISEWKWLNALKIWIILFFDRIFMFVIWRMAENNENESLNWWSRLILEKSMLDFKIISLMNEKNLYGLEIMLIQIFTLGYIFHRSETFQLNI